MKKQIISEEFQRMQKLAGIITESAYDKMGRIIRSLSPEEFSKFLKAIGEYDVWTNTPSKEIDPINNISDRMEVFSTYEEPEVQRWVELWKRYINS